jgi:uncharacterized membrane protein
MADTRTGYGPGAAPSASSMERLRTYSIVIYVLYLLAAPSIFSTMLIGVVIAYLKRGEARGTLFESHFANAVEIFWLALAVGLVALVLWPLFFLGALIHAALFLLVLYRTVKGLMRAIAWRPYD